MNRMINNIRLAWKLAYMLKTYRICNPIKEFSKYKFNKLLDGVSVTLLRRTLHVTWTKPYIYIYIVKIKIKINKKKMTST